MCRWSNMAARPDGASVSQLSPEAQLEQAAISIRRVDKVFQTDGGALSALKNINLEIPEGRFVAVVGSSGCGKSTLLRLVAGRMPTNQGGAFVRGGGGYAPGA